MSKAKITRIHPPAELGATILMPEKMVWNGPPGGFSGTMLRGDMKKDSEIYMFRVRWPAKFKSLPHSHPAERIVTVLSGIYYYGEGAEYDENAAIACTVGSVIIVPPHTSHFGFTEAGVEFQELGVPPKNDK